MGRHQNAPYESRRPARGRGIAIISLSGALVLAVILGIGAYALIGSSDDCNRTLRLSVVAAPDIAPAVRTTARDFNAAHSAPGRQCSRVTVSARQSADVMNALSGSGVVAGPIHPDVWIPDSSQWVDLVRSSAEGAGKVHTTGTTVAETPLIMAVPRATATSARGRLAKAGWRALVPGAAPGAGRLDPHILDPARNAGGMAVLVALQGMLGENRTGLTSLTAMIRRLQNRTAPDDNALFASRTTGGRPPVLVTTEQAVWAHNDRSSAHPATGVYPVDGSPYLDYPYVLTTGDAKRLAATEAFRSAVTSGSARHILQRLGFRTADGEAGPALSAAPGLRATAPHALPSPSPGAVDDVLQAWKRLMLGTRMLALLDVSGSMSTELPGAGITRMQAMQKFAQEGLREFPGTDEIGVRLFSTNLDGTRDWREIVPIGPLNAKINGEPRRRVIGDRLAAATPKPDGGTGLYDSILDAYRTMVRSYQPDKVNTVMVFTDGREDDPNGISLSTLLKRLHTEFDPDRPVSIFTIGFGPDIDPSAQEKIAEATNGDVYVTQDPTRIRQVFLQAVSRRICAPDCPK